MARRLRFRLRQHTAMNLFLLTVSQLTAQIKQTLETGFPLVWVVGEISSLKRAGSGHLYLNLKDPQAVVPAVIWKSTAGRLRFKLHDGLEVIIRGKLSVYPPHGEYRLVVDELEPKGIGAAELALKQLREKLARLGYFAPERKRPIPAFPKRLVLITSGTGAAVRDMLEILGRRWPAAEVWVIPTRVQGAQAAADIAWNLALLNRLTGVDTVILGRGGGSAEDLAVFNDERVAQAIFESRYPVISAVGHEIDVTLADLVADKRALTPSEAAELATPDRSELLARLDKTRSRLRDLLLGHLQTARKHLTTLAQRRVFREPLERIRDQERRLDDRHARLTRAMTHRLALAKKTIEHHALQLESLSPLKVLARGYSLTQKDGHVLRSAAEVANGDLVETRLHEGTITSRVESSEK